MARLNTLADGQPFTYQLLNTIIEAVNDIETPEGDDTELVTIKGPGTNNSKNKPMIIFDRDPIVIPESRTAESGRAQFRSNFNNQNPIVIATLVDNEDDSTPIGYLVVTAVDNKGFNYRVKLIRKRSKSTNMEINYVAIGVTSK